MTPQTALPTKIECAHTTTKSRLAGRGFTQICQTGFSLLAAICLVLCSWWSAAAQLTPVGTITNVAGTGTAGTSGDGGPATSAQFAGPEYLGMDAAGNLYIADTLNNRIRKLTISTGILTTVAGGGTLFTQGIPATSAALSSPRSVVVDSSGSLYIAEATGVGESALSRVRKVDGATGLISIIAGGNASGFSGDGGPGTAAKLAYPQQLLLDGAGNLLIADSNNSRVRKVVLSTGIITTIAGNGTYAVSGNGGPATSASFENPNGLAVDAQGNLYVGDSLSGLIRKITQGTGIVTAYAGNGSVASSGDGGPATNAGFLPLQLAFDPSGNLLLVDGPAEKVRSINAGTGVITSVAGKGVYGPTTAGAAALSTSLETPYGIIVDRAGNLYISQADGDVISKVSPSNVFPTTQINSSTVQNVYLQTTATEALTSFAIPHSLGGAQEFTLGTVTGCFVNGETPNPAGTVCTLPITFRPAYPGYRPTPIQAVTGTVNQNVGLNGLATGPLAVLSPGIISTYVGNGVRGYTGDGGPATSAEITNAFPAVDFAGNLYFSDDSSYVVRRVDAVTGIITTFAGNGIQSSSGDGGPATKAALNNPQNIVFDSAANVYILDVQAAVVRKVNVATGIISTVAGSLVAGHSGDGGPATSAQINPIALAIDQADNLYIVDGGSFDGTVGNTIRKVSADSGIITRIVGQGPSGYSGDGGPALSALLNFPTGIAVDTAQNLYISDSHNNVIRKVTADTGVITTLVGTGTYGISGDGGPASAATLEFPRSIVTDAAGDIYFTECCSTQVRMVNAVSGIISVIAGGGNPSSGVGDGGPATAAIFNSDDPIAIDALGNLYIGDYLYERIRKVNPASSALIYPTTTNVGSADATDDPQTAILANIGNASLLISPPSSGMNPAISPSWALDNAATCPQLSTGSAPGMLAAGASCTLATDFIPKVGGSLTGTLVVTDNSLYNPLSTQTVALSGTAQGAAGPTISLNPTSLTFATAQVGASNSAAQTITVSNTGAATATSLTITLGGINPQSFTMTNNCGSTLAVNSTCAIMVQFAPHAVNTNTATITVASNDANSPSTATLAGNGTSPGSLSIAPTSQTFASTTQGTKSATLTSTISNTTAQPIPLGAGMLTDAVDFTQSDNCNGSVAAVNGTCTVTFTFTPQSTGPLTSTYYINRGDDTEVQLQVALSGTGTAAPTPAAALTPASANFGSSTVGTATAAQTFTLTNAGNAALPITSVMIGGSSSFVITANNCGNSLAAGTSCQVSVNFNPATTGSLSGTLMVTDSVGTQTSALTGTGTAVPAPQAALTPASANFGSSTIGTATAAQTFTLANAGNASLSITSVSVVGSSSYAITANSCGNSLAAVASCQVSITFNPAATGTATAMLTITDSVGTQASALTGTGTAVPAAQAALTPAAANFGASTIGTATAAQTFTLTNAGNAALPITSITVAGSSAYAITANGCGTSLAAGASCQVQVNFKPTATGAATATLMVTDGVGTQTSTLTGTGLAALIPQAALNPASANFGSPNVGTASAPQAFTLTNAGNAALPITSITIAGSSAFAIAANTCGTSLAAGGSCQVSVVFTPTTSGSVAATLSVADSVGTQTSSLSGSGTAVVPADFTINATTPAQSSYLGSSVTYTIQLGSTTPANPFTSTVGLSLTGLPTGASASFSPASVTPGSSGATSTLTVTTPPTLGELETPARPSSGTLAITFAGILGCVLFGLRRRRLPSLLAMCLLGGISLMALSATGCGTGGNGFAIPTTTSTLTVTGTSGATVHTTSVTLTLK